MRHSEIIFVGLQPPALRAAHAAARLVVPETSITLPADLEAAMQGKRIARSQLLVLADPTGAELASATQALDAGGLPRWAVVVLGEASDLAESVPQAEWDPPLLARVFRSALQQHELLCENLRLRGDLKTVARRISHDLRTPIGCIQTTSYLMNELDAASVASMAGVIKQSSAEISQIIDRVGVVLKASADPSPSTTLEMGRLVASVLRQLETEIRDAGVVLTQPDSWPAATGVAPWVQVIWWNFVSNAIRHGGPAARIELAWTEDAGSYRFSVTDSGPGIPPARQTSLFVPFENLHALQAKGLGLSLTQRLVTLQKGRYGHETPPSGGSRFHFTLPAAAAKA